MSVDREVNETRTIPVADHLAYRIELTNLDRVRFTIQVKSGGNIDVYATDEFDYTRYINPGPNQRFEFFILASRENTSSFSAILNPQGSGTFYLILDNDADWEGGVQPSGPVTVDVQMMKETASFPGLSGSLVWIAGLAALTGGTVVVAVLLLLQRRRKIASRLPPLDAKDFPSTPPPLQPPEVPPPSDEERGP